MRLGIIIAALVCFAGVSVAAKADNLVTNPDFTATNTQYPGYTSGGFNVVAGWSGTGATGSTGYALDGFWNNGSLPSGDTTVGFIQQDGSLSTDLVGLTMGDTYTLSFLENARQNIDCDNCGATPTLTFSVGSDTLGSMAVYGVGGSNPFTLETYTFTATGTSEMLDFSSSTSGDGAVLLSDVSVTGTGPGVTPEPSALILLGTGLLGMAGIARRRLMHS